MNAKSEKSVTATFIKVAIAVIAAVACLYLPYDQMGLVGQYAVNPVEIRVISIFVLAALLWILEPFPIWTTSMGVIALMIFTLSDKGLSFLQYGADGEKFSNLISNKALMATFADPIIMLFLGGFFLAAAATKYKLDLNLARILVKPFGKNPKFVLLGLMSITALFSMFMSNTATAAMMIAILAPVLALFDKEDLGRAAFALAIPIGANIGGMGTPIGTPPNAIALKFLSESDISVSFGLWMAFGVPYVILMLLIAWALLLFLFPIKMKSMDLSTAEKFQSEFDKSPRAWVVYVTFAVTIFCWVFGEFLGFDANVVAFIPMGVFAVTGVINKKDLNDMSWDVLWLVAGGFALGVGLQKTGLAAHLIGAIPFASWPAALVLVGAGIICLFMANFMSHSATAALMIPILAAVGVGMGSALDSVGGVTCLLVSVAFASSLGMSLPISTPPNAIAYSTGFIEQKGMVKTGVFLGVVGLAAAMIMMLVLGNVGLFGHGSKDATEVVPATAAPAAEVVPATPAPAAETVPVVEAVPAPAQQ